MSTRKPVVGILECGRFSEAMTENHGAYSTLYANMLSAENHDDAAFDYRSFDVHLGDYPTLDDADAWLISGSRHGAYEDHDWIPPLEQHLRDAFEAKQPIIGVCFGHQILAQAFGGTVEKFSGGWGMGQMQYQLSGPFEQRVPDSTTLLAFHQDQVTELPQGATVVGTTPHCQYAALQYGQRALSIQPHPEFDDAFVSALLDERGHLFPSHNVATARSSLGPPLDNASVSSVLRDFILQGLA